MPAPRTTAYRRCTAAEADIIRRDLARLGGPAVARHLSALATAEGGTPVSYTWVYRRATALGIEARMGMSGRQRDARIAAMPAGRLHHDGLTRTAISVRLGVSVWTVERRIRLYYEALGIPSASYARRGQRRAVVSA